MKELDLLDEGIGMRIVMPDSEEDEVIVLFLSLDRSLADSVLINRSVTDDGTRALV